jgi:hypothetical protein
MNFSFNLKEKSAHFDADVEKLVEKHMDQKEKHPVEKKTRYQIKQEEKRKNEELKHKQMMQGCFFLLGIVAFSAIIGIIASIAGV